MKNTQAPNNYTHLPKKPDILVNIHIGKTGGSTMNSIISKQYKSSNEQYSPIEEVINCMLVPEQFYPYASIRKLDESFYLKLSEDQKAQIKYTGGHIGLEVLNFFTPNKNIKAFAMIREPKDLILSNYWYTVQLLKTFDFSTSDPETTQFIKKLINIDISNLDTMLLRFIKYVNYDNDTIRWFSRDNKLYDNNVPITKGIFQEVLNNIKESFLFIGLFSKFDESVIVLRRLMGWQFDKKLFYKVKNQTEFKMPSSSYPFTFLDRVNKRFAFENKLYIWLEKRFNSLIKLLGDDFDEEVRMYKRLNYIYQKNLQEFEKQLKLVQKKYKWATKLLGTDT